MEEYIRKKDLLDILDKLEKMVKAAPVRIISKDGLDCVNCYGAPPTIVGRIETLNL